MNAWATKIPYPHSKTCECTSLLCIIQHVYNVYRCVLKIRGIHVRSRYKYDVYKYVNDPSWLSLTKPINLFMMFDVVSRVHINSLFYKKISSYKGLLIFSPSTYMGANSYFNRFDMLLKFRLSSSLNSMGSLVNTIWYIQIL